MFGDGKSFPKDSPFLSKSEEKRIDIILNAMSDEELEERIAATKNPMFGLHLKSILNARIKARLKDKE